MRLRGSALFILVLVVACGGGGGGDDDGAAPDAAIADAPTGNSSLAALTPSLGALDPPFEPQITEYALSLGLADDAVAFTATAAVPAAATITVAGSAATSGVASDPVALDPGVQAVDILVTAAGGDATTYRVNVQRGQPMLEVSASGVAVDRLTPAFDPATTTYAVSVGLWVQALELTFVPVEAGSTITIAGSAATAGQPTPPLALNLGLTSFPIVVTPPNGAATTYTVNVTRASTVAQKAYGKASNTDTGDAFGYAVAMSEDTLVVSAESEDSAAIGVGGNQADNSAAFAGAAYVFVRSGSTWVQQAYLKASNTAVLDSFGASVALAGDTLAVGAPGEDSSATGVGGNQADNGAGESGAVYVFRRTGTTWAQEAYVKASNTGGADGFGYAVALSGDTLAVGAYQEDSAATGIDGNQADNTASSAGAVYVFTRAGTTWSQQAYVKASNAQAGDDFGESVALDGDTLAVGAYYEGSAATGVGGNQASNAAAASGAVYVFVRSGVTWSQQAYVKATNTGAGDNFGFSVALWGDTLAAGAYLEDSAAVGVAGNGADNTAADSGAVYVYTRSGTTWSPQAYIKASNTGASDDFGTSVALWGDTLAVGAYQEDSNATGVGGSQSDNSAAASGAAYVFTRAGTTWSQQSYVKASNTGSGDGFGYAVALWGDALAVGAPYEASNATGFGGNQADNSAAAAGAAYLYR